MPGVVHSPDDVAGRKAGDPKPKPSGVLPRPHVLARPAHNLPTQLSSFIGREREIADVKHLLSGSRLVTLTGAGGCGKTRLALQVATNLVDKYNDSVWWVELAALADPALVPQAVASALDVREVPNQPLSQTLANTLRSKQLLLALDNCEHLILACAQLAETLLQACPHLTILATSREPLGIAGERVCYVPTLSTPPAQLSSRPLLPQDVIQYEAVNLFVERADAAQPGFKLTQQNAPAVAQVCQLLDGIPLAIELAAARVKILTVEHLAARLDDRFNLLTAGNRTALPRHQTLRATMDWSYDLLSEPERALLRRLSVFAGGCMLEAAEQVVGEQVVGSREELLPTTYYRLPSTSILDLLSHLVDKSLVIVDNKGSETRYQMLETIRQYAREKLVESSEASAVQVRHGEWFVNLAEQAEPKLEGARQTEWLDRLRREYGNLRAALVWSLDNDPGVALRLSGALGQFWEMRGHLFGEPIVLLEKVLSTKEASGQLRARAKILGWLGQFKYLQADYAGAFSAYDKALALYQELNDKNGCANSLYYLGEIHASRGNDAEARTFYAQARSYFLQSLVVLRGSGDKWREARSLIWLGEMARIDGDYTSARSYYEQSLAIERELSDETGMALSLFNLGCVALYQGDYRQTATHFEDALVLFQKLGRQRGVADSLAFLAGLAGAIGQPERAARLFGAADALHETHGTRIGHADRVEYERNLAIARDQLDAATFKATWAEGRALTMEQAIAYALEAPAPRKQTVSPQKRRQAARQEFGGLTERERQVAARIAQGQSNREIAQELVVGERTVESHVANILNKLGFTARTQIAAWAAKKGLVSQKEE